MWPGFYKSAKENLFQNDIKHFFCFTDDENLLSEKTDDVTFIKEKNYGWPGNTLYRFRMFTSLYDVLPTYDYAYFFNANAFFVKPLSDEIVPRDGARIIAAQHFKMEGLDPILYSYDRNPRSTACVKWGEEGKDYVQACFIGATGEEMAKMSKILSDNIATDESNHVVAKWHDESHFNRYIIEKEYTLLPVSYVYPEVLQLPIDVNILMRRKEQFGNLNVLRYGRKNALRVLCEKVEFQRRKVVDYYHYALKKVGYYNKK